MPDRYLEAKAFVNHVASTSPKFSFESIFIDLENLKPYELVVKWKASGIWYVRPSRRACF